jgi:hypothetical protein
MPEAGDCLPRSGRGCPPSHPMSDSASTRPASPWGANRQPGRERELRRGRDALSARPSGDRYWPPVSPLASTLTYPCWIKNLQRQRASCLEAIGRCCCGVVVAVLAWVKDAGEGLVGYDKPDSFRRACTRRPIPGETRTLDGRPSWTPRPLREWHTQRNVGHRTTGCEPD